QPSPKTAMRLWLGWLFSVITFAVTLVLMYKYIANQNLFLFYAVITLYSVDIVLHFIFNIYAAKKQNIA
ncbi:MAG TPA: hypothetical protein VNG53_10870, partial [Bacteroidia bacterium]|nr:hypothetical protein [Bacteroidia bacterium]